MTAPSPAVREMARKVQTDWDCSDDSELSGAEYGYLRARADVEAEIEKEIQSHNVFSARMILQAFLDRLRNPPAPLPEIHPAVAEAAQILRQFLPGSARRAADALEAAARENGWTVKP